MGLLNRKKRFDDATTARVLASLRGIGYHPDTWVDRVEYSRDEFLEDILARYRRLLGSSLRKMVSLSSASRKYGPVTDSLESWLDDSKVDVEAGGEMVDSLSSLVTHYANLAGVIGMRRQLKELDPAVECVFLSFAAAPGLTGVSLMYVFLDRESYGLINDYLDLLAEGVKGDSSLYI